MLEIIIKYWSIIIMFASFSTPTFSANSFEENQNKYKCPQIIFVEENNFFKHGSKYARKKGLSPVLFTRLKEHKPELFENIDTVTFDKIYSVDTLNPELMYEMVKKLRLNVVAIVSSNDDTILPAAMLAQKLSLKHVDIEGLRNAYRKDKVRDILAHNNIIQPEYEVINMYSNANPSKVKYPLVVKPVRDGGAEAAYLCRNEEEYKNAIKEIQKKQFTFFGASRVAILIEEFIRGEFFYGAELLWNNNKWNLLGFTKQFIDPEKSLCMTGISFPSDIPENLSPYIEKQVLKWVELIGLKGGAINVEFKIYNDVPYLIEINPRLAGPNVHKQLQLVLGLSPIEYIIDEALGKEKELIFDNTKKEVFIADAFIFPEKSGILFEIDTPFCDPNYCVEAFYEFNKLPKKVDSKRRFSNVIGHVLTRGGSANDAMLKASKIVNQIEFKIISESDHLTVSP